MESTDLQIAAGLARLYLGEQDVQTIGPAFEQMLSLLAQMQNADDDETMPAVSTQADYVTAAKPVSVGFFRSDTAQEAAQEAAQDAAHKMAQEDTKEFMLSQAGERDGNFIVIPNVL